MILFGASGHAKVIIDILMKGDIGIDFLVDSNREIRELEGFDVKHQSDYEVGKEDLIIVAIGANSIRKKVAENLPCKFGKAIHPNAILSDRNMGEGSVIMAGVTINPSVQIGKHVIVNTSASIDHDCEIGDYTHVSPNATLCGTVKVGEGAHIGAGATVIPNLSIGKWSTVGAGTVVIHDIPDYAVVVGNPGKVIRYNER